MLHFLGHPHIKTINMFDKGIDLIENKPDWHLWQPTHACRNKKKIFYFFSLLTMSQIGLYQIMFYKGMGSIDNKLHWQQWQLAQSLATQKKKI